MSGVRRKESQRPSQLRSQRLGICALVLAPLILSPLATGCWSGGGPAVGPTDGSADGSAVDLGTNACNSLPAGTVVVQSTDSGISPAPSATGGTPAGGSYHLTSTVYYPAAGCVALGTSTGLTISWASAAATTGTLQTATVTTAGDFITESATFTINGTSLSLRIDCIFPDTFHLRGNSVQVPYSATATEIQLHGSSAACGDHIDTYDLD